VVTSKPANGGRVKTGQRTVSGTKLFYPACSPPGKPVLVRQLRGPHLNKCPWCRRRSVSASEDQTLKVWDLEMGAVVATFTCDAPPRPCAFADDRRIVAGDASRRVHFLWLERTGGTTRRRASFPRRRSSPCSSGATPRGW
jgi:hypothetical protein